MFGKDFFPTPELVIEEMMQGYDISGRAVLEPSAGKGNIVDWLIKNGAGSVIACEKNEDLKTILESKCNILADDFLTVTSHQVSHIEFIVMNPPFSKDEQHILHAWEIAPAGCKIISLCNLETVENRYNRRERERLAGLVEEHGSYVSLGECFSTAERKTNVDVALVKLVKPGQDYDNEFGGFFMEDDNEGPGSVGIMPYNVVRDLVNRYITAMKLFDEQLGLGVKMNSMIGEFFSIDGKMSFQCTTAGTPVLRNEFKKSLQKSAWNYIFEKLNMQKYSTKGLKEDINRFVERQQHVPFTMKNIYRMLEIVIGTQSSRMDKAILEVFEKLTSHYHDNRFNVEGWKTNSHFLVNRNFVMPWMTERGYNGGNMRIRYGNSNTEIIDDLQKAMCYITGMNYDECTPLNRFVEHINCGWGTWYCWGFFDIKGYKKGTMHFRFQNEELWGKFNQHVARLLGYPLFEAKDLTAWQKKQTGRTKNKAA